jgi:hypothetical protein
MIKPSIGRVVWFRPHKGDPLAFSDQPLAALVTYVHSDNMINLAVFDANGVAHSRTSVTLHQDGEGGKGYGYAEWMPYQKGQAAKTEAAEKALGQSVPVQVWTADGKPAFGRTMPSDPEVVEPGAPTISTGAGDHEAYAEAANV